MQRPLNPGERRPCRANPSLEIILLLVTGPAACRCLRDGLGWNRQRGGLIWAMSVGRSSMDQRFISALRALMQDSGGPLPSRAQPTVEATSFKLPGLCIFIGLSSSRSTRTGSPTLVGQHQSRFPSTIPRARPKSPPWPFVRHHRRMDLLTSLTILDRTMRGERRFK